MAMALHQQMTRDFMIRMRAEAQGWIQARTVALLREAPPGALSQHGTGILVAIAEDTFLVSAAHVLREAETTMLWINPVADGCRMIPLQGVEIHSTVNCDEEDIAFVHLPASVREELSPHKKFLRLSEIDWGAPSSGWYAVLGYPLVMNAQFLAAASIPTSGLYYACRLHDLDKQPLRTERADYTSVLNIALEFAPGASIDPKTGQIAPVPALGGISGCGMWRLYREGSPPNEWTADDIRFVGIEHALVGMRAIVGVRATHVLAALRTARPELGPAIDLRGTSRFLPLRARDVI